MRIITIILAIFSLFPLINSSSTQALDDRNWLTTKYLPSLEGRILFVGVNYYNDGHHKLVKTPETFETIDLLPERVQFGSPYKHHVGDFLEFDPGYKYDHICLFGIMGHLGNFANGQFFNIDTNDLITQSLEHANKLLKVGGTLQVGPNRISVPQFNTSFWLRRLKQHPLNKYEIISNAIGSCNMLWWGRKIRD